MKVKTFLASQKDVAQIEKQTQVHQLVTSCKTGDVNFFLNSRIRVWNNHGPIIPPMRVGELAVLNGDEYSVQVGFDFVNDHSLVVITYEVCDEGSLSKPVYVELDLTNYPYAVELDSIDVYGSTAVKMRNYNLMNIVSPVQLPKHSVCIFDYSEVLQLQKNNDLMGMAEILTHSNCILREGSLSELHPLVFDIVNNVPYENETYTVLAGMFAMGYNASLSSGSLVIILTGDDEFTLYPATSGCDVLYSQKNPTVISQQVQQALIAYGQTGNVDSQEFQAAVAAVGKIASQQGLSTSDTQIVANKIVPMLPSVKVSKIANVKDLNLSSEKVKRTGLKKLI